jgi:hypothetical protein
LHCPLCRCLLDKNKGKVKGISSKVNKKKAFELQDGKDPEKPEIIAEKPVGKSESQSENI